MVSRATLIIALLCSLPAAAANPPPEAKAHFEEGDKAFKLRDFNKAVEEYSKSYQLFPAPLLLYDLGQAYRQLGDYEKALFSYKQYLADAPTGKYRPIAEQKVAELEKLIQEQQKNRSAPPAGPANLEKDVGASTEPQPPPPKLHELTIPATTPTPVATEEPPRSRGWLWATLAAVAAVVVAGIVVLAIVASPRTPPPPMSTLGDYGVFK